MAPVSVPSNVKRTLRTWVRSAPSRSASGMRTVCKMGCSLELFTRTSEALVLTTAPTGTARSVYASNCTGSDGVPSPIASRTERLVGSGGFTTRLIVRLSLAVKRVLQAKFFHDRQDFQTIGQLRRPLFGEYEMFRFFWGKLAYKTN
jgi:hypothetical protein